MIYWNYYLAVTTPAGFFDPSLLTDSDRELMEQQGPDSVSIIADGKVTLTLLSLNYSIPKLRFINIWYTD